MDNSVNAEIRVGTTGTLDGSLTNELMLKGEFGPVYTATTTKDLMDREDLAQMEIKAIQLEHEKLPKMTYQQEIQHLVADTKRTKFISKLGIKQKENTLILFNYISHGKEIYNKIIELNEKKDRPIYFIAGEIDTKEREDIRSSMESHNDAILVASLGTFAQGVNIKNLHNIIFASPTKSQVRVLQAIGRGLRKFKDFKLTVYDVIDNYAGQRKDKNYAYKHGIERMKIYMKQQFKVTQHKLKI
jgi:superfamily II DNA or RNA helicase